MADAPLATASDSTPAPDADPAGTTSPVGESAPGADGGSLPANDNAAEAPKPEPEAPPPASPEEVKARAQFAALARKERELRRLERETRATAEQLKPLQDLLTKAREDPFALLAAQGVTAEQVVEWVQRQGAPPTAEDRVSRLEAQIKEREQREAEARQAAERQGMEAQIERYKAETIRKGIEASGDKYELVAIEGAYDAVWDTMVAYYREHGEQLPWEEAAAAVESELTARAEKLRAAKKFQRATPAAKQATNGAERTGSTLSSRNTSDVPAVINGDALPLDPDERNRALLAKFPLYR